MISNTKLYRNLAKWLLVAVFFVGCEDAGTTRQQLSGNESELPEELKGLKIKEF